MAQGTRGHREGSEQMLHSLSGLGSSVSSLTIQRDLDSALIVGELGPSPNPLLSRSLRASDQHVPLAPSLSLLFSPSQHSPL